MGDYTFSNGTTVTKGAHVVAPVIGIHRDESIYSNALEFDGFRFARMRVQDPESQKYNMVSTSLEWLQFGTGQHAWYLPLHYIPAHIKSGKTLCCSRSQNHACLYSTQLRRKMRGRTKAVRFQVPTSQHAKHECNNSV